MLAAQKNLANILAAKYYYAMYYIRAVLTQFPQGAASHGVDKEHMVKTFSDGLTEKGIPFTVEERGDDVVFLNEFGTVFASVCRIEPPPSPRKSR